MEKKLRHSHQRDMIYNYMLATKEHPSAEMIYEDLKKIEPNLSLGTVYRNLKLLEELGMVRKVTNVNNVERYDAMTYDHIHFVCDECGSVFDLPNFDNEVIKEKFSNEVGGEINWVNIILGGKCKHCREKLKN
jgi:Fur family peroxide stress response transcriptional regulator